MGVRTVPLRGELLDDLPTRCRSCLFWELGEDRPAPDPASSTHAARDRVRKQGWVTAQALEGTPPGVQLRDGDERLGFALFSPPGVLAARRGTVPAPSRDALVLATAWVAPHARGRGHGRLLVQAALREAVRLDLRGVEAHGDRRSREWDCVLPAGWLLHEGFEVTSEHPRYPLLRIDVSRVGRWAESLEHAVEELLGRGRVAQPVAQPQVPAETTRATGQPSSCAAQRRTAVASALAAACR
jgi:ribosomal protein S18 acetylase RimI-like enzyme